MPLLVEDRPWYRQSWAYATGIALLLLLVVRVQPVEQAQFLVTLPPDTVAYRPAKLDSIGIALARCFGKPVGMVAELRWFQTDSAIGESDYGGWRSPAAGRYVERWKTVLVKRPYQENAQIVDHELRHHLADRAGQHKPAVFEKRCP